MGIARAKIGLEYLKNMFTEERLNFFFVAQGIPKDAELINGEYDPISGNFHIDFEHPDFEDFENLDITIIE